MVLAAHLQRLYGVRYDPRTEIVITSGSSEALDIALRAILDPGDEVLCADPCYVAYLPATLMAGGSFVPVPTYAANDFRLLPHDIEAAITPDTTAILATHVYGNPCDVEAIDIIAKRHGLKVIYDAAHAFDVKFKGESILKWGDASALSFHATKLFHTVEGGAVVLHQEDHDKALRLLRSFGHVGDEHFTLGMNAKMSEVHAAMGMAVLPHVVAARVAVASSVAGGSAPSSRS